MRLCSLAMEECYYRSQTKLATLRDQTKPYKIYEHRFSAQPHVLSLHWHDPVTVRYFRESQKIGKIQNIEDLGGSRTNRQNIGKIEKIEDPGGRVPEKCKKIWVHRQPQG